jgi:peptide/nickel transport system substrate-binding protein
VRRNHTPFGGAMRRVLPFVAIAVALTATVSAVGPAVAAPAHRSGHASAAANGTLTVAITTSLDNFDPLTNAGDPFRNSVRLAMFDTLVAYNAQSRLQPSLATSWKTLQGGKIYVFTLRKTTWQDGKPLTPADVVYTFKRTADKKVGVYFADLLSDVVSAKAVGTDQVRVTLKAPSAGFLDALINMSIVQNNSGNSNRTHPIGTGPFEFVSFTPNEKLVLKRNPHYFRAGLPKANELDFVPVSDSQVAYQNLQASSVNVVTDLAPTLFKSAQSVHSLKVYEKPSTTMTYIDFFSKNMPSRDPRIRQAMMMCLDEKAVGTLAFQNIGTPLQDILPPGTPFYTPVANWPYDPAAAKKLLAAAGFPKGFSITIDGLQGFDSQNKALTVWQAGLKSCGINAKIRVQEFNTWLSAFFKHTLQVSVDVDSQGIDPNRFYNISFVGPHAGGGDAVDPKLLAVGKAADRALDPATRKKLYAQYARLAHLDLSAAPIYRTPTLYATTSAVTGITANLLGFYDFSSATVS